MGTKNVPTSTRISDIAIFVWDIMSPYCRVYQVCYKHTSLRVSPVLFQLNYYYVFIF